LPVQLDWSEQEWKLSRNQSVCLWSRCDQLDNGLCHKKSTCLWSRYYIDTFIGCKDERVSNCQHIDGYMCW